MPIRKLLNSRSKSVNQAAIILAVAVFFSQLLGILRDRILAKTFGAGLDLSIYYAAFSVPDFVYSIIFAGSIIVAFLPVFADHYTKDKEEAWEMANYVLNAFLVFTLAISGVLFLFAPQFIHLIAPGFDPEAQSKTVALTRLMLLSPIIFGLSSFLSSILQYFNRFLAYSLAPLLYNLGIILGVIFLAPRFGIFGAGLGVVIGAAAHLLIQVPAASKCGFKYRPLFDLKHPAVFKILNLTFFRSVAASLNQINFMAITAVASGISAGAVAIFKLSYNLSFFPIGIFGVSLAMAAFPSLSQNWTDGKKEEFYKNFSTAFRQVLYISLPIGILFYLLKDPIVGFLLQSGKFGMRDASLTAACLGIYSLAILPQCLMPLILRGFFSVKDTKTPVILSALFMALNIFLAVGFVALAGKANVFSSFLGSIFGFKPSPSLQMVSLCLAFLIALIFQFFLFMFSLYRKIGDFGIKEIGESFVKMLPAAFVLFAFGYYSLPKLAVFFGAGFLGSFWQDAVVGGFGFLLYFCITIAFDSPEAKTFISSILSRFKPYGRKTN